MNASDVTRADAAFYRPPIHSFLSWSAVRVQRTGQSAPGTPIHTIRSASTSFRRPRPQSCTPKTAPHRRAGRLRRWSPPRSRRLPVVFLELDVVLPKVNPDRAQRLEIQLLHILRRRLQNDLQLRVLEQPVRILPVAPVRRAPRRLQIRHLVRSWSQHTQKGLRRHGPRAHFDVIRLLQHAAALRPESLELQDKFLEGRRIGGLSQDRFLSGQREFARLVFPKMLIAPVILHTSSPASIKVSLSERLLDVFKSAVMAIEDPYLYRTVGVRRRLYSTSVAGTKVRRCAAGSRNTRFYGPCITRRNETRCSLPDRACLRVLSQYRPS